MAMGNDLKCMVSLEKLTDDERENVLAWAAKKWPAKPAMATSGAGMLGDKMTALGADPPRGKGG